VDRVASRPPEGGLNYPQIMRMVTVTLAAALVLSGCTAIMPDPSSNTATTATPTSDTKTQLPLSGEFVSQGAETTGTVTIAATSDTEFTITLSNFSTGAGDDLRLWLSEGELTLGADGAYYVDGDAQLELGGTIDPTDPEQSFVFPITALSDWDIRSFTVYDYPGRTAFGSAALD